MLDNITKVAGQIVEAGGSIVGIRSGTEEPSFTVERHIGDVEIRQLGGFMPAVTDPEDPIVRAAYDASREVCDREPILYPVAPWSGPVHDVCTTLDVPSVSFGVGNADSSDHAPNENILLADYFEGIRCVEAFMRRYAAI